MNFRTGIKSRQEVTMMSIRDASKSEGKTIPAVDNSERPEKDWQAKIAEAKEVRKARQESRKGKRATFSAASFGNL
jgi:hypothetical protein